MESAYSMELERIQSTFSEDASKIITNHINYIVKKYGNWKRYLRKIKKFLKKKFWWNLRNFGRIEHGKVKVIVR